MNNIIKIITYWEILNFFLIALIIRILYLVGGIELYLQNIFILSCAFYGLYCIYRLKRRLIIDYIVFCYIVWMAINGLFSNDYSYKVQAYYKAMIGGFSYALFYFWGRYSHFDLTTIFKNMLYPLLFCMFSGLYFFFRPPNWYIAMKFSNIENTNDMMHYEEIFRLSSFWGHPYHLCYAITLFSIYLQYKLLSGKSHYKVIDISLLLLCVVVLFCGQMRVCIIFFMVSLGLMMVMNNRKYMKSTFIYIYIAIFVSLSIFSISSLSKHLNYNYINSRFTMLTNEKSLKTRLQSTSGDIKEYSIWGEGFGKYQLIARHNKKYAIIDNQYANTITELGYLGLSLLLIIVFFSIYRMFRRQDHYIEICVVLFYFINWLGASSLINSSQYAFIFWFCLGRLWSETNYENSDYTNNKLKKMRLKKIIILYLNQRLTHGINNHRRLQ